ncbi:MAG: hypothetical protein ACO20U_00135 [Candidatus Planktophila sp.]
MKFLYSIALGAATALGATLIHQTLPPLGVSLGIFTTYVMVWWVGRYAGKRRYRLFALAAWFLVIARAGSFGVGQELLIQGDSAGSALLTLGFLAGFVAIFRKI